MREQLLTIPFQPRDESGVDVQRYGLLSRSGFAGLPSSPRGTAGSTGLGAHLTRSGFAGLLSSPRETAGSAGLGALSCHRDLRAEAARSGRVRAQIVTAQTAPPRGAPVGRGASGINMVLMIKGWARFRLDGKDTLARAGAWLHQTPGGVRSLQDYSIDMEYLEVVGPPELDPRDTAQHAEHSAVTRWN